MLTVDGDAKKKRKIRRRANERGGHSAFGEESSAGEEERERG